MVSRREILAAAASVLVTRGARADVDPAWRPCSCFSTASARPAIRADGGRLYGQKLAQAGAREILVETSTGDPFRAGNEALARTLGDAGVRHTFVELPGLHDQQWLRSAGTERMLGWFDALARA